MRLDVVVGNHDVDLVRPAAAQRLGELLGDRGEHLRLHPWALHVPGVLFAEHGHQHHAVHRLPTLLLAAADDHTPRAVSTHRLGREAGRAARGGGGRGQRTGSRARPSAGLEAAPTGGWSAWRQRVWGSAPRRRMRCGGPRASGSCPPWPARAGASSRRRIDAIAPGRRAAEGAPLSLLPGRRRSPPRSRHADGPRHPGRLVRLWSHASRRSGLDRGTATRWANTGTWCSDIRGGGPDLDDPRLFPFLEIDAAGDLQGRLSLLAGPPASPTRHTRERLSR